MAAYGGESVAFDLALDLVLNEVVEQARAATGATGAAIALARNGVMECRATTGQDAPDLGVRVETETGLSGACLRTGEVQDCSDTESDPRVDAEACRRLGVRSMLILPLSDGAKAFGILEVLSSKSHAFGPDDIEALKTLARRIVDSKSEAERGVAGLFSIEDHQSEPAAPAEKLPEKVVEIKLQGPMPVPAKANIAIDDPEPATRADLWTTVLVILVIVAAVTLGLLIGWRYAARKHVATRIAAKPVSTQPSDPPIPVTQAPVLPDRSEQVKQTREEISSSQSDSSTTAPPPGGLVVTQNGKVIYRSQPGARPIAAAPGTVIRSVEPQYPADARNQKIQGPVVLDVHVLRDGSVGTIGIVSGNPLLTEAAVHAVRQWKYQPNVVNGRTVESQTRVTINFTLPPAN